MPDPTPHNRFLVFRIGNDRFGVSIFEIREVVRFQEIQKVPRALPFVQGIIDLRGREIVPIVDLADRLGIKLDRGDPGQIRFIIAQVEGRPVGLMVSQVEEVVEVERKDLLPNPLGMDAPFITGVFRLKASRREEEEKRTEESRLVFVLTTQGLFTQEERIHLEEIRERFLKGAGSTPGEASTQGKSPRAELR